MKEFFDGMRYAFSGFRLLGKPGVRAYVLLPLGINLLLFTAAIVWGTGQVDAFIHWLSKQWQWLDWIAWLLWPLFIIIFMILIFFCFSVIANLVAAPFNGFLAAAVERALGGTANHAQTNARGLAAEIRHALHSEFTKFRYFAARGLPMLLLFLIPVIQLAAPPAWFVFGAWMLALEYLEYPMGNHGMLFPEVRMRVAQHRGLALGFGSGVLCLTLIPVVNFLAMPAAVAAGTRLARERFSTPALAPP